jgi:hypothetical protein
MADRDQTSRELVRREGTPLSIGPLPLHGLDDLARVANMLAKSGMFPDARTPEQVGVRMLYALTMGFQPIAGMMGVDIIEGNPTPNAHLWAAAIEDSPVYDWQVLERTDERCSIKFLRRETPAGKWTERGVVTWTLADAKRAGLEGKANWKRYPRAMLYARAITEGGRAYCPGLFGGVRAYDPDELGSEAPPPPVLAEVGDVIELGDVPSTPPPMTEAQLRAELARIDAEESRPNVGDDGEGDLDGDEQPPGAVPLFEDAATGREGDPDAA